MAETVQESDMGLGVGLALGFVAVLAAIVTAITAYLSFLVESGDLLQLYSGIAVAVAMLAGGLAIVAIHVK